MKLGIIISAATEENFRRTAELGLDFVEFCINGGNDGSELFDHMDEIKTWMKKYSLGVGSIGRWKTIEQLPDGTLDPFELEMAVKLMNAAKELGCSNYVCGCNYQPDRTLYENYTAAIAFFRYVLEHRPEGVDVSVYNCHKGNFVITPKEWEVVIGQLPELNIKYDPAHALDFGRDYLEELAAWGDRVKHVHLKGSCLSMVRESMIRPAVWTRQTGRAFWQFCVPVGLMGL